MSTAAADPTTAPPGSDMTEEQARAEFWRLMAEIDAVQARIHAEDRTIAQLKAESDLLRQETRETLARIEEQIGALRRTRQ